MAEIKKTEENVDKIKLLASLKEEKNLPKLFNVLREQKKRLDLIARALDDINRKKEEQALAEMLAQQREQEELLAQQESIKEQDIKADTQTVSPEKIDERQQAGEA